MDAKAGWACRWWGAAFRAYQAVVPWISNPLGFAEKLTMSSPYLSLAFPDPQSLFSVASVHLRTPSADDDARSPDQSMRCGGCELQPAVEPLNGKLVVA